MHHCGHVTGMVGNVPTPIAAPAPPVIDMIQMSPDCANWISTAGSAESHLPETLRLSLIFVFARRPAGADLSVIGY